MKRSIETYLIATHNQLHKHLLHMSSIFVVAGICSISPAGEAIDCLGASPNGCLVSRYHVLTSIKYKDKKNICFGDKRYEVSGNPIIYTSSSSTSDKFHEQVILLKLTEPVTEFEPCDFSTDGHDHITNSSNSGLAFAKSADKSHKTVESDTICFDTKRNYYQIEDHTDETNKTSNEPLSNGGGVFTCLEHKLVGVLLTNSIGSVSVLPIVYPITKNLSDWIVRNTAIDLAGNNPTPIDTEWLLVDRVDTIDPYVFLDSQEYKTIKAHQYDGIDQKLVYVEGKLLNPRQRQRDESSTDYHAWIDSQIIGAALGNSLDKNRYKIENVGKLSPGLGRSSSNVRRGHSPNRNSPQHDRRISSTSILN